MGIQLESESSITLSEDWQFKWGPQNEITVLEWIESLHDDDEPLATKTS